MAWIWHPKLDVTTEVPDGAELVWAHSGWQVTDPPPPPKLSPGGLQADTGPHDAHLVPGEHVVSSRAAKKKPAGPAQTTEE